MRKKKLEVIRNLSWHSANWKKVEGRWGAAYCAYKKKIIMASREEKK